MIHHFFHGNHKTKEYYKNLYQPCNISFLLFLATGNQLARIGETRDLRNKMKKTLAAIVILMFVGISIDSGKYW